MHSGKLWFDNSDNTLEVKILPALTYIQRKYGFTPDLCYMHPTMFPATLASVTLDQNKVSTITVDGQLIIVRSYNPVLPGHLYLGIGDEAEMVRYRLALGIPALDQN